MPRRIFEPQAGALREAGKHRSLGSEPFRREPVEDRSHPVERIRQVGLVGREGLHERPRVPRPARRIRRHIGDVRKADRRPDAEDIGGIGAPSVQAQHAEPRLSQRSTDMAEAEIGQRSGKHRRHCRLAFTICRPGGARSASALCGRNGRAADSRAIHPERPSAQRLQPRLDRARLPSRNGGSDSLSPRLSIGSSTAKPGPSVAISKRMPFGSRKYSERK